VDSYYIADNCAEYLRKFYVLPHSYQESFARRVIVPLLAMGIIVPLMATAALVLFSVVQNHPEPGGHGKGSVLLFCAIGLLAILFFGSAIKAKVVISHNAIEATGSFSKTKILATQVLGYAADYIQQPKGPTYLRFCIVHGAPGQQEARTRIVFDPNDLTDAKLQGLFRSMHNYGSENLEDVLVAVHEGKFTGQTTFVVVAFSGLVIFTLWRCIPLIMSSL
jgi:hypothetical protein